MILSRFALLTALALLLGTSQAHAFERVALTSEVQASCNAFSSESGKRLCVDAHSVPDLIFPTEVKSAVAPVPQMGIYKPPGDGPFPALILMHTCAGMASQEQIPEWGRLALSKGYVVFVLDSFTQRGIVGDVGCDGEAGKVMHSARVRDGDMALIYLSQFPFVDKARVAAMGFSQGARMAYLLSSDHFAKPFTKGGARFAALVAVYGECYATQEKFSFIQPDMTVPVLALLGDKDNDGKVSECLPRFEQVKAKGARIEWRVFEGVGHDFDMPSIVPAQKVAFSEPPFFTIKGYDENATRQSHDMAFEFLSRVMK